MSSLILNTIVSMHFAAQKGLVFLLLSCCYLLVWGQSAPSISVLEGDSTFDLALVDLKVQARIMGNTATTTLEMTFFNPLDRDLQGKLNFPLPEGAAVARYALEINGKLREGVVVEKWKGRQAYESIVRQAIDPGLLEMTDGNNFTTTIYPIPAGGTKRVLIAYEEALRYADGDDFYTCPLHFSDQVDRFSFTAIAEDQPFAPVMQSHPLGVRPFRYRSQAYIMELVAKKYIPDTPITLLCPVNREEAQIFTEEKDGKTWFYLRNFVGREAIAKKLPKTICLAWDVSRSGAFRDHEKELALLDRYFRKVGDFRLKLLTFSNAVHEKRSFQVRNGQWEAARQFLESQAYDGATQLGVLHLERWEADEILLLSDGLSTFGAENPGLPAIPVYIIHAGPSADAPPMQYLAARTQGAYIDLHQNSREAAMTLLAEQPYRFLSGKYRRGKVVETYPSLPTPCPESFSLAGVLEGRSSKVELRFGYGNTVVDKLKYEIRRPDSEGQKAGTQRLWAQKKLDELRMLEAKNQAEITDLGLEYGLVTPFTSLIVLDRVEDYVEFEIDPPRELQAAYDSLLAIRKEFQVRRELEVVEEEVDRLEEVLDAYLDLIDWWKGGETDEEEGEKSGFLPVREGLFRIKGGDVAPAPLQMPTQVGEDSIRKVRGQVKDAESGEPLAGVRIFLETSQSGCITDMDGNFVLTVYKKDRKLTLKYLGYVTQELDVRKVGPKVVFEMMSAAEKLETVSVRIASSQLVGVEVSGSGTNSPFGLSQVPKDVLIVLDGVVQDTVPVVAEADIVAREFIQAERAIALYGARATKGLLVIRTQAAAGDDENFLSFPPWDSTMPYLGTLRATPQGERYARYLSLRDTFGTSPAFFLDVADFFLEKGRKEDGLRVLTNLAEFDLGNHELLRTLAFYLQRMQQREAAVSVLRKVKEMRPEEPQSFRDLALALQQAGHYQEALDLFDEMLRKDWSRVADLFWGIEEVALLEMNQLIATAPVNLDLTHIDERLVQALPVRLRIVIDWNRLDTDIDLHVIDPNGEEAFYSNQETEIGGYMTEDMVDGYGPETFLLKEAMPGEYQVKVDYYDEAIYNVVGQTFLKVTVFTDYGRPTQRQRIYTYRLAAKADQAEVVRFILD